MLVNYILSHVQILSLQTNKQLMVEAEYDNNTNTTTNNNLYFIHGIKIHQMLLWKVKNEAQNTDVSKKKKKKFWNLF